MKHNFQKGYTLVEMITVIAIIMIAAGIFANFGSSQRQLALQRDIYTFAQNIRRVQQMASSISTVTNCSPKQVPGNGYGIFLEKGQTKYMLYANCDCDLRDAVTNKCIGQYEPPLGSDPYNSTEKLMNAPINLSNQVEILKITGKKSGVVTSDDMAGVVILYQPPDPIVQIYAPGETVSLDEVLIEMKLKDSLSRIVEINRAGLVNVKQQNQ